MNGANRFHSKIIMKTKQVGLIKTIADFLFPRTCCICGYVNPKGRFDFLCPNCAKNIAYVLGGKCNVCGEILGPNNMPNINGCPMCAELDIAYTKALCPVVFDGAIKKLIHELKYSQAQYVAKDLIKIALLHNETSEFLKEAIVVPVPIGKIRKMTRGYNQTEVLARTIQKIAPELNTKTVNLLKRIKNTSTQTRLDRNERIKNMYNAFAINTSVALPTRHSKIVILDDVITTTATINECAKVLKKAGFKNIFVFSFAKRM